MQKKLLQEFHLDSKGYYIIISALTEFKKIERAIDYFRTKEALSKLVIV
jgi:hypothetical protein